MGYVDIRTRGRTGSVIQSETTNIHNYRISKLDQLQRLLKKPDAPATHLGERIKGIIYAQVRSIYKKISETVHELVHTN